MHTFRYRRLGIFHLLYFSVFDCRHLGPATYLYIVGFFFHHPTDPENVFNGKNFPIYGILCLLCNACVWDVYYILHIKCGTRCDVVFFLRLFSCVQTESRRANPLARFDYSITHLNIRLVWKSNSNSSDNYCIPQNQTGRVKPLTVRECIYNCWLVWSVLHWISVPLPSRPIISPKNNRYTCKSKCLSLK